MTDYRNDPRTSLRVVWTRGKGCLELASAISGDAATRVTGDIDSALVEQRADLLVARRLSHRAVSTAAPTDFHPGTFDRVVAAVGGGPHSSLASEVARAIGRSLGVPARLICAFREPEDRDDAVATLYRLNEVVPGIDGDIVQTKTPQGLISHVGETTLLILGAPGGSWVHRMFIGPGARMVSAAPAGAVVVRRAARRAFQVMAEPIYVSPMLGADDAVRLSEAEVLPVVDRGMLVGTVRRSALQLAGSGVTVGGLMDPPESVDVTGSLLAAGDVAARQGGGPVAVIDEAGRLVGTVPLAAIRSNQGW